jgi:acyl-CoA synthetase (AMP-forming)/AMP-acid ligase II
VIRQAVSDAHDLLVFKVVLLRRGNIPKTSSGKIQRHLCMAKFLSGEFQEHRLKAGILKTGNEGHRVDGSALSA